MDIERLKRFHLDILLPTEGEDMITAGYKKILVQKFESVFEEDQSQVAYIGSFIGIVLMDLSLVGINGAAAWEWKSKVAYGGNIQADYAQMASTIQANKLLRELDQTLRTIDEDRKAAEEKAIREAAERKSREEVLAAEEIKRQESRERQEVRLNRWGLALAGFGLVGILFDFMSWGNGKTQADIAFEDRKTPALEQRLRSSDEAWTSLKANLDRTNLRLKRLESISSLRIRGSATP